MEKNNQVNEKALKSKARIGINPYYMLFSCAAFLIISMSYYHQLESNVLKLHKGVQGTSICFERVAQTYSALMSQSLASPSLTQEFQATTNRCLNELDSHLSSLGLSADSMNSGIYWFLNKIDQIKEKIQRDPYYDLRSNQLLTPDFEKLNDEKTSILASIENEHQSIVSQSENILLALKLMVAAILFLCVYILLIERKAKVRLNAIVESFKSLNQEEENYFDKLKFNESMRSLSLFIGQPRQFLMDIVARNDLFLLEGANQTQSQSFDDLSSIGELNTFQGTRGAVDVDVDVDDTATEDSALNKLREEDREIFFDSTNRTSPLSSCANLSVDRLIKHIDEKRETLFESIDIEFLKTIDQPDMNKKIILQEDKTIDDLKNFTLSVMDSCLYFVQGINSKKIIRLTVKSLGNQMLFKISCPNTSIETKHLSILNSQSLMIDHRQFSSSDEWDPVSELSKNIRSFGVEVRFRNLGDSLEVDYSLPMFLGEKKILDVKKTTKRELLKEFRRDS